MGLTTGFRRQRTQSTQKESLMTLHSQYSSAQTSAPSALRVRYPALIEAMNQRLAVDNGVAAPRLYAVPPR